MADDETAGDIERRIGILRSYAQAIPVAPEALDLDVVLQLIDGRGEMRADDTLAQEARGAHA